MAKKNSSKISKHMAKKLERQAIAELRGATLPDRFEKIPMTSWYPGHMLKAQREMREKLKLVDIIIELVDARIPASSLNPVFDPIFANKPRLLVMNKAALADPKRSQEWIDFFASRGRTAIAVDAVSNRNVNKIIPTIQEIMSKEKRKQFRLSTRCMIVGVPNVGKSTLINRLARKNIATTGPRPGVTKKQQWVTLPGDVELLDTPGVLFPRIDTKADELNLALTANIKDDLVGRQITAEYLIYRLYKAGKQGVLGLDLDESIYEDPELGYQPVLEAYGLKRGLLGQEGAADLQQASAALLHLYREGKVASLTLDGPSDLEEKERFAQVLAEREAEMEKKKQSLKK